MIQTYARVDEAYCGLARDRIADELARDALDRRFPDVPEADGLGYAGVMVQRDHRCVTVRLVWDLRRGSALA